MPIKIATTELYNSYHKKDADPKFIQESRLF